MTIRAGMLNERVSFRKNDGSRAFTRKAYVNSGYAQLAAPTYDDYDILITVRYDSETKALVPKDFFVYEGWRYTIDKVDLRKRERLVDITGGSRKDVG